MLSNKQISDFFEKTPARISENRYLRVPQVEGYEAARSFFDEGGHRAVEQIPVGCGKTGLITILPFGIARGRVLVVAPNLTIKRQLADGFDATSRNASIGRQVFLATSLPDRTLRCSTLTPTSQTVARHMLSSRTFSSWPSGQSDGCLNSRMASST